MSIFSECTSLSDYIIRAQVDAILWKAEKLLGNIDNPIVRNDRVNDIARTIALLPPGQQVVKDDYIQQISKKYNITRKTLEKIVADSTIIEEKKKDIVRAVRKNTVMKLKGEQKTFPFFLEKIDVNKTTHAKTFRGVTIDIERFIQLLSSFGFTRYANENADDKDGYTFVRLIDNVIKEVSKEEIIDHMENFIRTEYDFDGAGCEFVDSGILLNTFYERLSKYFSKDLFARVRNTAPIIINRDTEKECFLYFKNGFVRCTATGYELVKFDKMEGSVWQKQMLSRTFTKTDLQYQTKDDGLDLEMTFTTDRPLGDYADFIWRISGMKQQRYISLCSILGYLMHDYYDYKLKCVFFTDSTVAEESNGRTGKSLSMKMLRNIRSIADVDGKGFDQNDNFKYKDADRSTQIMHINDLVHRGKFKFDFEGIYNEILEGYTVNKKFQQPFRQRSKFVLSSNKSMNFKGDSMTDRVLEFEVSDFFSPKRSPDKYYGRWMGKGWDEDEWNRFDNFMCECACVFLKHGLITPDTINLEARKLLDSTCREFLDFMQDIVENIRTNFTPWQGYNGLPTAMDRQTDLAAFEFDKGELFTKFITDYPDWKGYHITQKKFTTWLRTYATNALHIKAVLERRSNGKQYIQFKETNPTQE